VVGGSEGKVPAFQGQGAGVWRMVESVSDSVASSNLYLSIQSVSQSVSGFEIRKRHFFIMKYSRTKWFLSHLSFLPSNDERVSRIVTRHPRDYQHDATHHQETDCTLRNSH
jgi:hypothetical protein